MNVTPSAEPRLLALEAATLFTFTESGRLWHENAPDRPSAPRLWLAGCAEGTIGRVRFDVGNNTAQTLASLVATEPPLCGRDDVPVHLDAYVELLAADAPVQELCRGLSYSVPTTVRYEHGAARVVASDTGEGAPLLERLLADGMPEGLASMGFRNAGDFWPPWCVALVDDTIVSVAFTARLSPEGAEVGVATPLAYRGRGFGATAVAAWAALPPLARRVRFYSTEAANISSQRVAERLQLDFLGPSLSIR